MVQCQEIIEIFIKIVIMENFGSKRSFRSCFGNINLEPLEQSIRSSNSTKIVVNYSVLHRSVRSFSKTIVYSVLHRSVRSFSKTIKHTTKRVQSQPIKSFCRLKPVSLDFHLTRNHLNTSENKRSRCPPSPAS